MYQIPLKVAALTGKRITAYIYQQGKYNKLIIKDLPGLENVNLRPYRPNRDSNLSLRYARVNHLDVIQTVTKMIEDAYLSVMNEEGKDAVDTDTKSKSTDDRGGAESKSQPGATAADVRESVVSLYNRGRGAKSTSSDRERGEKNGKVFLAENDDKKNTINAEARDWAVQGTQ